MPCLRLLYEVRVMKTALIIIGVAIAAAVIVLARAYREMKRSSDPYRDGSEDSLGGE